MFFYSKTEDYVKKFLKRLFIVEPSGLSINRISASMNLTVKYWEFSSETVIRKSKCIVFLNEAQSEQAQWQEFTHELCHILWHVGRQEHLPKSFVELQEWQAEYFSYHLCVPTFMLQKIPKLSVQAIMHTFNVERGFAEKRLEMYKSKFIYEERGKYGKLSEV